MTGDVQDAIRCCILLENMTGDVHDAMRCLYIARKYDW